jgi:hypothetical protein
MPEVEYLTASDMLALVELFFRRLRTADPSREWAVAPRVGRLSPTKCSPTTPPPMILQAAALTNGLVLIHPLGDGNKRAGWIGLVAFLSVNDRPLPRDLYVPLAEQIIGQQRTADRSRADVLLADWLRARLEPNPDNRSRRLTRFTIPDRHRSQSGSGSGRSGTQATQ